MWKIVFTKDSLKDLEKIKSAHLDKKVKELIDVLKNNPFQNPPIYEKLVGDLSGGYSRRINLKHRLVYQIYIGQFVKDGVEYNGYVKIISMWTNYEK